MSWVVELTTARQVQPGTTIDIEPKKPSSFDELSSVEIGSRGVMSTSSSLLAHKLFRQRREGILKYDLDGMSAAAAFRRAAERRVDVADPRTGYSGCDRASHLTVAQDVTATDDHGTLLPLDNHSTDRHSLKPGSFGSILIPIEYDVGQPHALSSARQACFRNLGPNELAFFCAPFAGGCQK